MGHSDGFAVPRVHPHRPAGRNVHLAAFASASLRLGTEGKGWFRTRAAERAPFPPRELTLTKIDPIDLRALPSPFTSEIHSVGTLRSHWMALSDWTEGPSNEHLVGSRAPQAESRDVGLVASVIGTAM